MSEIDKAHMVVGWMVLLIFAGSAVASCTVFGLAVAVIVKLLTSK